ncbi:tRNA guanosine(34) transglycosylase Tgt [SAR202 cluster bacterium AC-647-N09_OGT_505m]|nr:tRNA guanosine(34) transglycosylase Tgt [SAR202 cluster bacterium AC-647-N09_OGT_505m]
MPNLFQVRANDGQARVGILTTAHGQVDTPAFLPVATQGSVKAVAPDDLKSLGATILLSNTYHLMLRPGIQVVRKLGGLQAFMSWPGPILTDSGGFQTLSLDRLSRVSEEGVMFRSHIDGSQHFLSPETSLEYQALLGADIAMVLDQCPPYRLEEVQVQLAMNRTHRWAMRSKDAHRQEGQALFAIVQGGVSPDLRLESAATLVSMDFDGYAVGGLSVGEPKASMYQMVSLMGETLPDYKPRYLMGVGSPEDLIECVARGMDIFDCALPTRVARNGGLFTYHGRVNVDSAPFREQNNPIDESCDCYTCQTFSAAYLHHLFKARELLAYRLASIHNLRFVIRLMEDTRRSISHGAFAAFRERFLSEYHTTDEAVRRLQKEKWLRRR